MKSQQNIIVGLVLSPIITFSGQSVLAFDITPNQPGAATQYIPEETYMIDTQEWVTRLRPPSVSKLPKGGTKKLNALLDPFRKMGGWTFVPEANVPNLTGSFNIEIYRAKGSPNNVGADFQLVYNPQGTDPVTRDALQLHWIQIVSDNHNITDNPGHGNLENTIDATTAKQLTDLARLFYDIDFPLVKGVNLSTPPRFQDGPSRSDGDKPHTWTAELYLASINTNNPKTVTIYNGVQWGWENFCQKNCGGSRQPIPESSSILGLLALGTLGMASAFKRKSGLKIINKIAQLPPN